MERLSLQLLDERADHFNALVRKTPEIDKFCSSTYWTIPAHLAFANHRPVWIRQSEAGYLALALGNRFNRGPCLEPLEFVWGSGCPLVGPDTESLLDSLEQEMHLLRRRRIPILLAGLPWGGRLFRGLIRKFHPYMDVRHGSLTRCFRASLANGLDGFMSRRSASFRANVRRSSRQAHAAGFQFEYISRVANREEMQALYRRVVAIERKSWKGELGTGLLEPSMFEFYQQMLTRLWTSQSLRVLIVRHQDEDVGFVMGALLDGIYRGLQISFNQRYRHHSLGNVLQYEIIVRLCQEPCDLYDLGVGMEYKERWGEDIFETILLMLE